MATKLPDRFQVLKALGQGAMGQVVLVREQGRAEPVAVKSVLGSREHGAELMQRFSREARVMALVDHPNVLRIHHFDLEWEPPYLVMELVEGMSLLHAIKTRARLPVPEVARLAKELGSALDALHAQGILHRDIKPANIMLRSRDGSCVLMDLGLASYSIFTAITKTGQVVGTPRYLPPELVRGGAWTARGDLFQLGVILFEALTGVHMIQARSLSEIQAVLEQGRWTPFPAEAEPISAAVKEVVLRAVSVDPEARFGSGVELSGALAGALATGRAPVGAAAAPTSPSPSPVPPPAPPPVQTPSARFPVPTAKPLLTVPVAAPAARPAASAAPASPATLAKPGAAVAALLAVLGLGLAWGRGEPPARKTFEASALALAGLQAAELARRDSWPPGAREAVRSLGACLDPLLAPGFLDPPTRGRALSLWNDFSAADALSIVAAGKAWTGGPAAGRLGSRADPGAGDAAGRPVGAELEGPDGPVQGGATGIDLGAGALRHLVFRWPAGLARAGVLTLAADCWKLPPAAALRIQAGDPGGLDLLLVPVEPAAEPGPYRGTVALALPADLAPGDGQQLRLALVDGAGAAAGTARVRAVRLAVRP